MLILGGYLKVREFVYTWVVIELIAILNRIDTRAILPRREGSCMYIDSNGIKNKDVLKHPYLFLYHEKEVKSLYPNGIQKNVLLAQR